MANVDRPAGLKPVKYLSGAPWNGKANVYFVPDTDATALFKGDPVKSAGGADPTGKYPTVVQAAAGEAVRGVVIGFGEEPFVMVNPTNSDRTHRPANAAMYVMVVDDPNVIFEVQEDSDGGALTADAIGSSADLVVGAGDVKSGRSGVELDSSSAATVAATCKILRAVNREDNELGDHCKFEVLIAEHEMKLATGV